MQTIEKIAKNLNIETEQVQNLIYLARYLFTLPKEYENFHMGSYFEVPEVGVLEYIKLTRYDRIQAETETLAPKDPFTDVHACGAVACAIGHSLQVPEIYTEALSSTGLSWYELATILYGQHDEGADFGVYIFNARWSKVDDTAQGAAQRITAILANSGEREKVFGYSEYITREVFLSCDIHKDVVELYKHYTIDDLPKM